MKLNLGCGLDHRPGYLNVDIDPNTRPDLVHDLTQPLPFEPSSVSEVLLQDVLEHLTKEDGVVLLKRCARVLQTQGKLVVRVPHVLNIIDKFENEEDLMMHYLYGNTSKNGVWGAHKYGYTPSLMRELAQEIGLDLHLSTVDDTNYCFVLLKSSQSAQLTIKGSNQLSLAERKWLSQKKSGQYLVCTDLWCFLIWSVIGRLQAKTIIWSLSKKYPVWLGKLLLQPYLRIVSHVMVSSSGVFEYVSLQLHYSHLRIVMLQSRK